MVRPANNQSVRTDLVCDDDRLANKDTKNAPEFEEKKIVVVTWTKMEDTRRTNKRYRNEKYSVRNENIAG